MIAIPELSLQWSDYEGRYAALEARELNSDNVSEWLRDWSALYDEVEELGSRIYVAKTVNTTDAQISQAYDTYVSDIYPPKAQAEQRLKEKLLASGLEPQGFEIPLRNMRSQAALFREENVALQSEEMKVSAEYGEVVGAQTIEWNGQELTVTQLSRELQGQDRDRRETAWRAIARRQLNDRAKIDAIWEKLLDLRLRIAKNAGHSDYRSYRWAELQRFDYTPDDCRGFHEAILSEVVPLCKELMEDRRQKLGLASLRPWDFDVDADGREPLRPFDSNEQFIERAQAAIDRVHPELGAYYRDMRENGLLDLDNRKGKGPGGYCTYFNQVRKPFIFMNAVGKQGDVRTLLHELGHAFHAYEAARLPYHQLHDYDTEFAEVASMSMELLAGTFIREEHGSYYDETSYRRAWTEQIHKIVLFLPYMAVVDAFQHWAYENPVDAANSVQRDSKWADLYRRYLPWEDWSGLDESLSTGWQRKLHITEVPFYYIEYGMAQLGALQVYANFRKDRESAVAMYRRGLALGGSVTLPKMFEAAGARFAFDADTVRNLMALCREVLEENRS